MAQSANPYYLSKSLTRRSPLHSAVRPSVPLRPGWPPHPDRDADRHSLDYGAPRQCHPAALPVAALTAPFEDLEIGEQLPQKADVGTFIEKASRLYEQERNAASAATALEMHVRRWLRWAASGKMSVGLPSVTPGSTRLSYERS